jgi:hypothetical protein
MLCTAFMSFSFPFPGREADVGGFAGTVGAAIPPAQRDAVLGWRRRSPKPGAPASISSVMYCWAQNRASSSML